MSVNPGDGLNQVYPWGSRLQPPLAYSPSLHPPHPHPEVPFCPHGSHLLSLIVSPVPPKTPSLGAVWEDIPSPG